MQVIELKKCQGALTAEKLHASGKPGEVWKGLRQTHPIKDPSHRNERYPSLASYRLDSTDFVMADGQLFKPEKDYTKEADKQIPEAEELAKVLMALCLTEDFSR